MAQIPYRANLSSATFPMTLAKSGRSVIIPGPDQMFDRRVDPAGEQRNAGIPQVIYMENCVPTADGYQSVGYVNCPAFSVAGKTVLGAVEIPIDSTGKTRVLLQYSDGTKNFNFVGTAHTLNNDTFALSSTICQGVCYSLLASDLYTNSVVGVTPTLTNITASVSPAGFLGANGIIWIISSFNYLIALSLSTVYWSSTTTPTDFNPSLVTGSGSENLNNAGQILFAKASSRGFYIFTTTGIIEAQYTGNRLYPFRFIPVGDTDQVNIPQQSYGSADTTSNIILEQNSYIKLLQNQGAREDLTDISELLERTHLFDSFDYTTDIFSLIQSSLSTTITYNYKIHLHQNKYLIISYQIESVDTHNRPVFSKALIIDTHLKRYGVLKITHTNIFTALQPDGAINLDEHQKLCAFYNVVNGTVKYLHFDVNQITPLAASFSYAQMQGVFILGRLQYARSRFICLDELDVESTQPSSLVSVGSRNFGVFVLPSLDGKNFGAAQVPTLRSSSTGDLASYVSHAEGKNLCIGVKGTFDLTSIELKFHLGGKW